VAVFERYSGEHVSERVKPEDGSEDAERLEALAAEGADGWRKVAPAKKAPAKKTRE
jgi:hypothetical protein